MRRLPCTLAGLAVFWLSHAAAHAQTKAVAVLGVEAQDAPAELAAKLTDALQTQVRQSAGFRLLPGKSLEEIKLVFGCVDEKPDCMARVGRSLSAGKLIWGTLKKSGTGYNLTLKYLDVGSAGIEKLVNENVTTAELAGRGVQAVVARLTRSFLPGGRGALRISANVEGAQAEVAGKAEGAVTPGGLVVRDLPAGTVEVRVSKPGYRSWSQSVVVKSGDTTAVEAQLQATAEVSAATQPSSQPGPAPSTRTGWKAAFWISAVVTVGLGAGIVGAGVTVLNRQKDKDTAIESYKGPDVGFRNPDTDVCKAAEGISQASDISNACKSGQKWADVTNAFIGLTVAAGLATGFFYYKAFISKDTPAAEQTTKAMQQKRAVDWVVAPSVGPTGGGLGLHVQF